MVQNEEAPQDRKTLNRKLFLMSTTTVEKCKLLKLSQKQNVNKEKRVSHINHKQQIGNKI